MPNSMTTPCIAASAGGLNICYPGRMGVGAMEPQVFIQIDENPNCTPVDGLVFQPRTAPAAVWQVQTVRRGTEMWCQITGLDEPGTPCPAMACLIADSGDGACYLIFGATWRLRLKTGHRR